MDDFHFAIPVASNSAKTTRPRRKIPFSTGLSLFQSFDLTPNQKKIVVLGMNGKEISPSDIYKCMNTRDRNVYDQEVSGLRKANVLEEILTNRAASLVAKKRQIDKRKIPRFRVNSSFEAKTGQQQIALVISKT